MVLSRNFLFIFFLNFSLIYAQEITSKVVDSLYKEDQFYIGTTYNLIGNKPNSLTQSGFSLGFHLGFIKDIPMSKKRNTAIGIGVGYSTNSYIQNMLIQKDNFGNFSYSIINNSINFSKNKFSEHLIEMPIEFRWRTSTVSSYKFWRIYLGIKLGYVFATRSRFEGDIGEFKFNNNTDFNKFQYGLTLTAGYNTWNIYVNYGLNDVFSNTALLNGRPLGINTIKIGLMFYIY